MNLLLWEKGFETGLTEVDQQHLQLVDVTNRFGTLLSQNQVDFVALEEIFAELVSYTQYHFDTEEQLMRGTAIDARHVRLHEQEHHGFLQDLAVMYSEVVSDDNSAKNLFDFLLNWLVYHILGTDHSMGRQLKAVEQGISPSAAFATEKQERDQAAGLLLRSLDHLFTQVMQRNAQLRELNQTLEAKVAERTRALSEANQRLEIEATTDALTGVANRHRAMQVLELLWQQALAADRSLACILIDADRFKNINDTFGHDAGDKVLCGLAKQLQYSVRTDDLVCRLGGDEFLVICPNTRRDGVQHLAEQLHETVGRLIVPVGAGEWRGSISVGLAVRSAAMQTPEDLIKLADKGVYAAKAAGRNRIRFAD